MLDLASQALGGSVVAATDEFFAPRDSLVDPATPGFRPATFGAKGQVYDGWETRRRRDTGEDHAIVRLGAAGVVRSVVVDTAYFVANHPPEASVEACGMEGYPAPDELTGWETIVPRSPLRGNAANEFTVDRERRFTHVRLTIHPDGGVARLRVYGEPVPDPRLWTDGPLDLAAAELGGTVVECSDMFYGAPGNLLLPGLARVMGEGWETARRRDGGNDWVVMRLGVPGLIHQAELDTSHFKGNAPGAAALSGQDGDGSWFDLLPRTRLQPDTRHRFRCAGGRVATRVRLDVYPDGGMARLRLFGRPTETDLAEAFRRFLALLPPDQRNMVASD